MKTPTKEKTEIKHDHKSADDIEIEITENRLRMVVLALEIMTAVCAKLPDPEESEIEEEEEEMEDTADEDASDTDQMADAEVLEEPQRPKDAVANGTLTLISSLTQPLLGLARPTALSFVYPSPHPPTTSALNSIHIRALECLNNLFMGINPEESALPDGAAAQAVQVWNEVWAGVLRPLGKQSEWTVGTGHVSERTQVWDIAVGGLWGLARICKGELVPNGEEVTALIEFADWHQDELVKVKVIATLGCIAQRGDAIEANKVGCYEGGGAGQSISYSLIRPLLRISSTTSQRHCLRLGQSPFQKPLYTPLRLSLTFSRTRRSRTM